MCVKFRDKEQAVHFAQELSKTKIKPINGSRSSATGTSKNKIGKAKTKNKAGGITDYFITR